MGREESTGNPTSLLFSPLPSVLGMEGGRGLLWLGWGASPIWMGSYIASWLPPPPHLEREKRGMAARKGDPLVFPTLLPFFCVPRKTLGVVAFFLSQFFSGARVSFLEEEWHNCVS